MLVSLKINFFSREKFINDKKIQIYINKEKILELVKHNNWKIEKML